MCLFFALIIVPGFAHPWYMCPKNGDHASATYDVQSVADMVMVISERDHKINTNLHTNIKIDDTLDALFKADHVILIWCNFITSFIIFTVTTWQLRRLS